MEGSLVYKDKSFVFIRTSGGVQSCHWNLVQKLHKVNKGVMKEVDKDLFRKGRI